MKNKDLPIGTRIRFTKTLVCPANEDHPDQVYAFKGDTGVIVGHGTSEGYWAKWDGWLHSFGIAPDEFEVIEADAPAQIVRQHPEI